MKLEKTTNIADGHNVRQWQIYTLKHLYIQECIPAECISSAAVAVSPAKHAPLLPPSHAQPPTPAMHAPTTHTLSMHAPCHAPPARPPPGQNDSLSGTTVADGKYVDLRFKMTKTGKFALVYASCSVLTLVNPMPRLKM